ncbi:hypothetical protein E4U36_005138 [Claviceps purpurea]|nr:hypothetical protein E4U36_005138 [Claviceps purpurea]
MRGANLAETLGFLAVALAIGPLEADIIFSISVGVAGGFVESVVVLRVRELASATRFSSATLSRLAARRDCHFYGYRTRRCRFCYDNSVSVEVEFSIVQSSYVF